MRGGAKVSAFGAKVSGLAFGDRREPIFEDDDDRRDWLVVPTDGLEQRD